VSRVACRVAEEKLNPEQWSKIRVHGRDRAGVVVGFRDLKREPFSNPSIFSTTPDTRHYWEN